MLVLIFTALMCGCATTRPITCVSVLDADFQKVKSLSSEELAEFERQWQDKQEVEVALSDVAGDHYKVDIAQGKGGGRWLYQTTGYASVLSHKKMAVYKLRDPEAFNKLIGADHNLDRAALRDPSE